MTSSHQASASDATPVPPTPNIRLVKLGSGQALPEGVICSDCPQANRDSSRPIIPERVYPPAATGIETTIDGETRTTVLTAPGTMAEAQAFYQDALVKSGWQPSFLRESMAERGASEAEIARYLSFRYLNGPGLPAIGLILEFAEHDGATTVTMIESGSGPSTIHWSDQ